MSRHANVALFVPHAGCPHRCSFCDQQAISGHSRPLTAEDVTAACKRAEETMRVPAENAEIAFFGGSFTALDPAYRRCLLEAAYPFVEKGSFAGIRLSTRPDCIDEAVLSELRRYGVTAIELGAQSMDDGVLLANGRGHTAAHTREAARLIRESGFALGLQMMTGLYTATEDSDRETARQLLALSPSAVRIYPTVVLKHTRLAALYEAGLYTPPTLEKTERLCAELLTLFERQGVPVIRLGLHDEPSLRQNYVAGPLHPALRELAESRQYREAVLALLAAVPPGAVTVRVAPTALSRMIGQTRRNIHALGERGFAVTVRPDAALAPGDIRIEREETDTDDTEILGTSRI